MIKQLVLVGTLTTGALQAGGIYDANNWTKVPSEQFCAGDLVATGNKENKNDVFTFACVGNKLFSTKVEIVNGKRNIIPVTNVGFPCSCNPTSSKGTGPAGIHMNTLRQWEEY